MSTPGRKMNMFRMCCMIWDMEIVLFTFQPGKKCHCQSKNGRITCPNLLEYP